MDSSSEARGGGGFALEEHLEAQTISVLDHINGFQCTKEKSDSFVIDMERFSHSINKDINTNSRITVSFFYFFFHFSFILLSFPSFCLLVDNFPCSWFSNTHAIAIHCLFCQIIIICMLYCFIDSNGRLVIWSILFE